MALARVPIAMVVVGSLDILEAESVALYSQCKYLRSISLLPQRGSEYNMATNLLGGIGLSLWSSSVDDRS